jgi:hypothetical protein
MKYLAIGLVTLLTGCTATAPLEFSPVEQPAGYPVFIGVEDGSCRYGVQDMILMGDNSLADWMNGLPEKSRQIDLVLESGAAKCIARAQRLMLKAGFSDVRLRKRGDVIYFGGLPPA